MDGTSATPVQAATAIQATLPRPVPNTPAPTLSPLPALPSFSSNSELITACPKQAQWALVTLLGITTLLLAAHTLRTLAFFPRFTELQSAEPLTCRLDVNQASQAELMQLPGIGPKLAQRIIENRNQYGPFQKIQDLTRVSGIGKAKLKRMEKWICVEKPADEKKPPPELKNQIQLTRSKSQKPAAPTKVVKENQAKFPSNIKKETAWDGPLLDLNTASIEQLDKLPRIGPVLAKRIIEERNLRHFESVDELKRVKGIGPKTLAGLRPYVTVGK